MRPKSLTWNTERQASPAFVHRACFTVLEELGCLTLPLLLWDPEHQISSAEGFKDMAGLGIGKTKRVEKRQSVGSSEVTTEVLSFKDSDDEDSECDKLMSDELEGDETEN